MFDRSQISTDEERDEAGAGITLSDIGRALMIWVSMQEKPPTVALAATVFNTMPDIIRDAVNEDQWTFLLPTNEDDPRKQVIEVDDD